MNPYQCCVRECTPDNRLGVPSGPRRRANSRSPSAGEFGERSWHLMTRRSLPRTLRSPTGTGDQLAVRKFKEERVDAADGPHVRVLYSRVIDSPHQGDFFSLVRQPRHMEPECDQMRTVCLKRRSKCRERPRPSGGGWPWRTSDASAGEIVRSADVAIRSWGWVFMTFNDTAPIRTRIARGTSRSPPNHISEVRMLGAYRAESRDLLNQR